MSHGPNSGNPAGNGSYERRDISIAAIVYFLLGLAVTSGLIVMLIWGLYHVLEGRDQARQTTASPLVTNTPTDTRHLTVDYKDYLKQNFPNPQLEINERDQLDKIRQDEAQVLNSYEWVDQKAGTVRIPIDRAMDLVVQRGLPTRGQGAAAERPAADSGKNAKEKNAKGKKK